LNGKVTVRRAEVGDAPALAELNGMVQEFHRAHEPDVYKSPDIAEVAAWYAARLDDELARVWVADASGVVVDYVAVLTTSREEHLFCRARTWWEVGQIGVRPCWRRKGVARAVAGRRARTPDAAV